MKHSKTTKAMALMLSMVMITSVFVGNTLSRYVTSVSSTDSARVAVWGINGGTSTMNLFDVEYIKDGKIVAASSNKDTNPDDKIIAPGTAGEAEFNIINFEQNVAPEVMYEVAIELDDSQIADEIRNNTSIQWKLDDGAWGTLDALKTSILSLSGDTSGVKVFEPGQFADAFEGTQSHKIAWQWVMDNSNNTTDTDMGNLAVNGPISAVIKVGITATQVDSFNRTVKDIALNGLTYEDIFTSLNVYSAGDFESSLNGKVNKGTPVITDEVFNSGDYSLKAFGNSQVYANLNTTFRGTADYYVAAKIRVDRFASGSAGIWFDLYSDLRNYYKTDINKSTNGEFVTISAIHSVTNPGEGSSGGQIFIGSFGDLDTYIDDIVIIPLAKLGINPTKYELDKAYSKYASFDDKGKANTDYYQDFLDAMNVKAQSIGMTNSYFKSSSGLGKSTETYSTSRDIMKLMVEATKYERLENVWNTKYKEISITGDNTRIESLVSSVQDIDLEMKYPIRGKTGTLTYEDEGKTINIAAITEIDGQTVVGVIMKADTEAGRFDALEELFDISSNILRDPSYDTSDISVTHSVSAISCLITNDGYEILYEQEADNIYSPCSLTKVLTMITALDYIGENNETFTIKQFDIENGSGNIFSKGDSLTYDSAFFAIMLPSSNTAAKAIARIVSERFINN